jgi:hypothetical protein
MGGKERCVNNVYTLRDITALNLGLLFAWRKNMNCPNNKMANCNYMGCSIWLLDRIIVGHNVREYPHNTPEWISFAINDFITAFALEYKIKRSEVKVTEEHTPTGCILSIIEAKNV